MIMTYVGSAMLHSAKQIYDDDPPFRTLQRRIARQRVLRRAMDRAMFVSAQECRKRDYEHNGYEDNDEDECNESSDLPLLLTRTPSSSASRLLKLHSVGNWDNCLRTFGRSGI